MTQVVAFHSFRRGAGTSNILASCAAIMAAQGKRVGVIDMDFQSPSAHILFGLSGDRLKKSINDYLWESADLRDAVYDVTPAAVSGKIYLAPASSDVGSIMRILREGYDADRLNKALSEISKRFELDLLMIDTSAGLNEETLVTLAISDILMLLLKLDKHDYQGTAVIASLAEKLAIPRMELIVNHVPATFAFEDVRREVEEKYETPVAAIFPYTEQMLLLASAGIFALQFPSHPLTLALERLTDSFRK
jgi:MinD-like ATPase involved in chromosome partitioning or flagellar assembly